MTTLVLWSIFCFILGAMSFAFFKASAYRVLPAKGDLQLSALFSHTMIQEGESFNQGEPTLIITLRNSGVDPIRLESWYLRSLNSSGFLHQLFIAPQNLVTTLEAGEKTSLEIQDLSFLEGERLHTIVVRDIYGREWELKGDQVKTLRKNFFWNSL